MEKNLEEIDLISIIKDCYTLTECADKIYGNKTMKYCAKISRFCKKNNIDYSSLFKKKEEKHFYCLYCGKEMFGKEKSRKKFCNHSCSASYNNKGKKQSIETRIKRSHAIQKRNPNFDGIYKEIEEKRYKNYEQFDADKEYFCLNCGKKIDNPYASKMNKFCSKKCSAEYKHKKIIDMWKNGEYHGSSETIPKAIKTYLLEKSNYKCEECGFEGYNKLTNKTILQIHHKDGDSSNNSENNLQVLCPNCHAMTETFANCGKRKSSRVRYDSKTYFFDKFKKEHDII